MYPTDVTIEIDGEDVTKWIFGTDTITLTNVDNTWRDIDISSFISGPGVHQIRVLSGGGVGRVEARVEIV